MNPEVRRAVIDLVARHGPSLLDDPRQFASVLADVVPDARAERSALERAVWLGLPAELRKLQTGPGLATSMTALANELAQRAGGGLTVHDAAWTVGTLAAALGISGGGTLPTDQDSSETIPERRRTPYHQYALVAGVVLSLLAAAAVGGVLLLTRDNGSAGDAANRDPSTQTLTPGSTTPTSQTPTTTPTTTPVAVPPPSPFVSAELYEFARYLFDADECSVPDRESFPVAYEEPDTELLKCVSRDAPYTGTFWCKDGVRELLADRDVYLGYAVEGTMRPVVGRPAGHDEPIDGVQVAYKRMGGYNGRVYWDSPEQLCAGELQANDEDVGATISYWLRGQAS